MNDPVIFLIEHILSIEKSASWAGHPGWPEIVKEARAARDKMTNDALDADAGLDSVDRSHLDYDPVQQQEIDMADQAHINDLRFGADSDGWCPDEHGGW